MSMYNLIEYSDNYSATSGSLWQYFKDIRAVNNNSDIIDFYEANVITTCQTGNMEQKKLK